MIYLLYLLLLLRYPSFVNIILWNANLLLFLILYMSIFNFRCHPFSLTCLCIRIFSLTSWRHIIISISTTIITLLIIIIPTTTILPIISPLVSLRQIITRITILIYSQQLPILLKWTFKFTHKLLMSFLSIVQPHVWNKIHSIIIIRGTIVIIWRLWLRILLFL